MSAMSALTPQPWVVTEGSGAGADTFSDLALTSGGQVLVAGSGNLAAPSPGGRDLHLSLRDARGRVIWQWNGGGEEDDAFLGVAPYGSTTVAVGFLGVGGNRNAVWRRFTSDGDLFDSGSLASSTATDEQYNDLAVLPTGQVVLVGVSRGDGSIDGLTKANPNPIGLDRGLGDGLITILSPGSTLKQLPDGSTTTLLSGGGRISRLIGGSGDDGLLAVSVVPSGSKAGTILVAGYQTLPASGDLQGYLAAYDSAGTRLWERFLGSATAADRLMAVVCDASAVYVAGTTRGVLPGGGVTRDAGRTDADPFLAAFDLSGGVLWSRQREGSGLDETTAKLALAGNRLELISGDGSSISRASFSTAGQLQSSSTLLSSSVGGTRLETVLATSSGQVVVAGSSDAAWLERPAGGPADAWLQFSGPGLSAYQVEVQPFDAQGQLRTTSLSLDPGAGLKLAAGNYAALTGRLTVDAAGAALYTPYPELPELHGWSGTLQDSLQLNVTDLNGQAVGRLELVLLVAPPAALAPNQTVTLSANRASATVRPLGLARPELRLSLSDTTYTTSLGASRSLSAFSGDSAAISLRLAVDRAPLTALNALRYARETLYDRTIFHRVIAGFMVQGGGFSADQRSASGFGAATGFAPIPLEGGLSSGLLNQRGSVAMARTSNPHSATNQFFVNVVNNGFLDATAGTATDGSGNAGYAVFGAVSSGLAVVDAIAAAPLRNGANGGNDSSWGAPKSDALFENITEPVVVIEQARVQAAPDQILYALVTPPANGQVSLDPQAGSFTYIPGAGYAGSDSFEVRATTPALGGLPERSVVRRISVSGVDGRASHSLPSQPGGSRLELSDPAVVFASVLSNGSPDWITAAAPLELTLQARSSQTWGSGYAAWNTGSPGSPGTGERLPLQGLARYSFVANAIATATTSIVLEPDKDSAFFVHDAYSAFHAGLSLSDDSSGRPSTRRLLEVDTIRMGSAGGTSIVDLTSPDYSSGPVTVHGAAKGTSVFWGSQADDTFISGGADAVIFGGGGRNRHELGAGRETLQYRAGSAAEDVVVGFDPGRDRLQLWLGAGQVGIEPLFSSVGDGTRLSWAGNQVTFLGLNNLSLSNLTLLSATASL